jgi:hypothetical protein
VDWVLEPLRNGAQFTLPRDVIREPLAKHHRVHSAPSPDVGRDNSGRSTLERNREEAPQSRWCSSAKRIGPGWITNLRALSDLLSATSAESLIWWRTAVPATSSHRCSSIRIFSWFGVQGARAPTGENGMFRVSGIPIAASNDRHRPRHPAVEHSAGWKAVEAEHCRLLAGE